MDQTNVEVNMRILMAAKKLFAKKGFYNTTIREICREAGVHKMMHTYNFQRKENVLIALFQVFFPVTNTIDSINATTDPVANLKIIIREFVNLRINDPEIILILQHEITLPQPRDEIVQFLVTPLWSELKKILIEGKSIGLFKFGSVDITMIFIISSILMFRPWEFFQGIIRDDNLNTDLERVTEELCSLILGALNYPNQN